MFVPPYQSLSQALGLARLDLYKKSDIKVPAALLRLLLEQLLQQSEFDEQDYLARNPDVAKAVADGTVSSARDHYVMFGYWEARPGATTAVDEDWYVQTYPDVAAAIKADAIPSGKRHYLDHGRREFRAPNASALNDCQRWQVILGECAAAAPKPKAKSKAESRKPKAESRKPKAESRKPKADSRIQARQRTRRR